MSKIAISNLSPAGSDLFLDSDSFLTDLTDTELDRTNGGLLITITITVTLLLKKC